MVSVRCIVRIASSAAQKLGELVSMASMASRGVLRRSSCRARGNCTTATVTFTAIRLVAIVDSNKVSCQMACERNSRQ